MRASAITLAALLLATGTAQAMPRADDVHAPLMKTIYQPGYFPALDLVDRSFPWLQLPPVEYDHPYQGRLLVINADQVLIRRMCEQTAKRSGKYKGYAPLPENTVACAFRKNIIELDPNADCVIFLSSNKLDAPSNVIMRHEIGHCNGWDSHDGMRNNLNPEEIEHENELAQAQGAVR